MKKTTLKTSLLALLLLAVLTAGDWAWMSSATAQPATMQRVGYAEQRQRLVSGLQLDAAQQAKLDAISSEMLPRLMALRGLSQAERAPAEARLKLEMQQKINAMLTSDQRAAYELMQAKKASGSAGS